MERKKYVKAGVLFILCYWMQVKQELNMYNHLKKNVIIWDAQIIEKNQMNYIVILVYTNKSFYDNNISYKINV